MLQRDRGVDVGSSAPQLRFERLIGSEGLLLTTERPHGTFLLAYLEEAVGSYRIDDEDLEAGEADLILLSPQHEIDPYGLSVVRGTVMTFRADAVLSRRPDETSPLPLLTDPAWPWGPGAADRRVCVPGHERSLWASRIELLEWEIENEAEGYQQAIRAHLTALLIGASRLGAPLTEVAAQVHPAVREMLEVIEEDFEGRLSLEGVARKIGRSPRHLSRLIRDLTGNTVMHWIDERRMEEARRLLLESDHTVETIADRVGYQDTGYFRRRFRRTHGHSPGAWRRENG